MRYFLMVWCTLFIGFGCATVPFQTEPQSDFRGVDPQNVVSEFQGVCGSNFEALESVVFSFFGKEMAGMGYISINAAERVYALTCMTPAGIKIFEFRGMGDELEKLFVPPPLEKREDKFAESVARDIRRIYFDPIPSSDAEFKLKKNRLVYWQLTKDGKIEYTYAGSRRVLVRKRFFRGHRVQSNICYYEYKNIGDKLYPYGIVLHNKQYNYKLVLRIKEIYPQSANE